MCGFDRCLMAVAGVLITGGLPLMLSRIEVGEVLLFGAVFIAIWVAYRRIQAKLGSHDDRMNDVAAHVQKLIQDVEGLMRDSVTIQLDAAGILHDAFVGHGSGPQRVYRR